MAHTIYAGKISKRKNSTLQPTLGTSFDVLLKSPTSLHAPTFTISAGSFDYNYLKWGDRYYFVTNVTSVRTGLWEVSAVIDVLATFKSEILNTTAYVVYDSVANTELPDNRLPMKTSKSVQANSVACPFVPDGGCFILSLTGANGTTGVYKVDEIQLAALIDDASTIENNLFNPPVAPTPPTPPTSGTVADEVQFVGDMLFYFADCVKWILDVLTYPISQFFGSGNIPENIRECRFIPFNVGVTGTPNAIYLGTWLSSQVLGKLQTETVHRTTTVNIPWQASDYRRRSPFTEIYIYLPYIGMIKLSSENLTGQSSITVEYTLAMRDGSLICTLSSGGEILGQYSGNVGASVPIGISNINLPRAGQSIVAGMASVATDNIVGVGMGALNFINALTPNYTSIGGLDGIAATAANQNIICYTVFHDTIAPPNQNLAVIGSPSMCSKSLSTLTGYCQCLDAHVSAAGEAEELEEIDAYLNSGFYIE